MVCIWLRFVQVNNKNKNYLDIFLLIKKKLMNKNGKDG